MSKWIDADALIDAHYQYCCDHDYEGATFEMWSRDLMESAPSIDIVRCADCKHWNEWENRTGSCHRSENGYNWFGVDSDDYCSFGERKDV